MKYMYTNEPDSLCHEIHGVYGRPVNTADQPKLKAKGWVYNPKNLEVAEKKAEKKSLAEQAEALGIPFLDKDGNKIHHATLAKAIEAHNGGTDEG